MFRVYESCHKARKRQEFLRKAKVLKNCEMKEKWLENEITNLVTFSKFIFDYQNGKQAKLRVLCIQSGVRTLIY